MTIWFTSDLHFGHKNIIEYCNRPFKNIDDMNETLILNWNSRIQFQDSVYIVGDFALCKPDQAALILRRLKGQKFLIEGNHDKGCLKSQEFKDQFAWIKPIYELKLPDPDAPTGTQRIVLLHYSMRVWNKSHHGSWHLYGHSHGSLPDDPNSLSIDVGVDANNYQPISYQEVKRRMSLKTWKPIDHHTGYHE